MSTPIPIKPCPVCGSRKVYHVHEHFSDKWNLECSECHWCGKSHRLHRKAIKLWNRQYVNSVYNEVLSDFKKSKIV